MVGTVFSGWLGVADVLWGGWSEYDAWVLVGFRIAAVGWSRRDGSSGRLLWEGVYNSVFVGFFSDLWEASLLNRSDCGRGAGCAEIFGSADFQELFFAVD